MDVAYTTSVAAAAASGFVRPLTPHSSRMAARNMSIHLPSLARDNHADDQKEENCVVPNWDESSTASSSGTPRAKHRGVPRVEEDDSALPMTPTGEPITPIGMTIGNPFSIKQEPVDHVQPMETTPSVASDSGSTSEESPSANESDPSLMVVDQAAAERIRTFVQSATKRDVAELVVKLVRTKQEATKTGEQNAQLRKGITMMRARMLEDGRRATAAEQDNTKLRAGLSALTGRYKALANALKEEKNKKTVRRLEEVNLAAALARENAALKAQNADLQRRLAAAADMFAQMTGKKRSHAESTAEDSAVHAESDAAPTDAEPAAKRARLA